MSPPPQWLLAHKPNARERQREGNGRQWLIIAMSALWGCLFVAGHRRLDATAYLRTLTNAYDAAYTAYHARRADTTQLSSVYQVVETSLLQEAQYFLNDPTVRLSPYVPRPWLHYHNSIAEATANSDTEALETMEKPKRKLVLTDYGWNQVDRDEGLGKFPRSLRTRELLQAFVDHPDFDPTFSWREMMHGKVPIDRTLEYVVFLDLETCFESNYPYSLGEFEVNADTQQHRLVNEKLDNPCFGVINCYDPYLKEIFNSPLFRSVNASTLLYFDCRGNGPDPKFREKIKTPQITILSISSGPNTILDEADMGMPPPAPHPISLTKQQRQAIETCDAELSEHRPFLLTYLGRDRIGSPRKNLRKLHNGYDLLMMDVPWFEEQQRLGHTNETFETLLSKALFSATPRGDNRFSYRFTEVMSAGAIPVVHSDGWILPFHKTLVDWTRCAVVIPEAEIFRTEEILRQISPQERCEMRKYCYEIYQKYMVNPEANLAGILDGIGSARRNYPRT